MEKELKFIFSGYTIENDCMLSASGAVTVGFEVLQPEIFTSSDKELETVSQSLVKALKVLPKHTIFHQQDCFKEAGYQANFEDLSFLSHSSERHFFERRELEHHCRIFLTLKPSNKIITSINSSLLRRHIVPEKSLDTAIIQDFLNAAGQFAQIINDANKKLIPITTDRLISHADQAGIIEQYCFLSGENETLIKDIQFKDDFKIGQHFATLYTLADLDGLPAFCGPAITYEPYSTDRTRSAVGFAASLGLLLSCNHIYNQYIFIGDSSQTIKALESKKLRLQSLSAYSRGNAIARDGVNDFLNEAAADQRLPVKMHLNILVFDTDKNKLKELGNKVMAAAASIEAVPKLETTGAPQIWCAGIPGMEAEFPVNETFDTFLEQAVCFVNTETNYQKGTSGIRFAERISGMPVWVDLFDEPMRRGIITNRNLFVCGGSGGGKSMAMNHILRTLYEQMAHCVIVDIGNSYQGLCKLVGGIYFTYTEDKPIRFNPFYLAAGESLDTEKKESLKSLLVSLWKKENENFNRSEYVALSNALQGYYDHLKNNEGIFPSFNSFYEWLKTSYVDILKEQQVKDRDFDMDNFLYVLQPYYKGGEFDYLLNATENLDLLHERFVVFELDTIKNHPILFPVVTLVIMELFISKMRKLPGVRKILAVDEAWIAIAKSGMADFIKYLYKTVRKFNGIAALITQEIDDLLSSPIIKETVINLSDIKLLTDMRKFMNRFDELQAVLGLSEKGKSILLSVNRANDTTKKYREVFIDLGGQIMKVYRNELSKEEYYAYTTEATEKIKVMESAEKWGSMEKGIQMIPPSPLKGEL